MTESALTDCEIDTRHSYEKLTTGSQCGILSGSQHKHQVLKYVCDRISVGQAGVHSHDICRNFCSACAVTVVIFGHFNRSFTY